ncbi:thiamin pyrophosphokinase [Fusibacter sp. 3D3]|nr:thiamin pyrophosphokinase [Fusibacter sp. 3D3]
MVVLNGAYIDYRKLKAILKERFKTQNPEVVLGVDGGTNHLESLGLTPTHILGDLDSIEHIDVYKEKFKEAEWIVYPIEKDYTDSELAFETAKSLGCNELVVIGAFGGRLDHMLGTILLLNRYSDGVDIELLDLQNQIRLIQGPLVYPLIKKEIPYRYVSLVPISNQVTGVYLDGFKYPLNNATIKLGETIGISNEVLKDHASVTLSSGKLLMIFSRDSEGPF